MRKRRYEILLPLKGNDGQPITAETLNQTREELVARFDAVTVYPQPAMGMWQHEGRRYEDELVRLVIDVEDSPENLYVFTNLKAQLIERFNQIEIYITSFPVDIV